MSAPTVYLAGPEVFLRSARAIGEAKKAICRDRGLNPQYPLDIEPELGDLTRLPGPERAAQIFAALIRQMDRSDAIIANLTPFRGPSADVGTAFELGYAHGRGLRVFAYTNDAAHYAARVDPDGLQIEAFDLADNLMLEGAARAGGSDLGILRVPADHLFASSFDDDDPPQLTDLQAFEVCVDRAAAALV